jgi:hypothetical protein
LVFVLIMFVSLVACRVPLVDAAPSLTRGRLQLFDRYLRIDLDNGGACIRQGESWLNIHGDVDSEAIAQLRHRHIEACDPVGVDGVLKIEHCEQELVECKRSTNTHLLLARVLIEELPYIGIVKAAV